MDHLPSRGVRVRGEHLTRGSAWWYLPWLLLALFIVVGSAGRWATYEPRLWAPTLVNPVDIARNVALYVPFGIFGMLALRRNDLKGAVRVTVIAMLFSFLNEALQLYTVDRVASLTDIVSAAVGTASGSAVAAWLVMPK